MYVIGLHQLIFTGSFTLTINGFIAQWVYFKKVLVMLKIELKLFILIILIELNMAIQTIEYKKVKHNNR